jgi:hypothetical protein
MKQRLLLILVLGLCLGVGDVRGETAPAKALSNTPGADLAHNLSVLTGVAITPLLGTSAYGALTYYRAPADKRANLPWFAQPWFFVPALTLVALCFLKDTAGTALPTAVKKPLDIAEAVEHKISGLIAAGAFVPLLMIFMKNSGAPEALLGPTGMGAVELHWAYNLLIVPVSLAAFVIVFLASNAINVLIILSPFTSVDAALKGFRLAILGTVTASAWANPWIGAAWALVIILVSYFIAGWSLRLSHFGLVLTWDFFTFRRVRFTPDAQANKMFLGRSVNKVPIRTYGKLSRNTAGRLVLDYRPWLVLPRRTLELPAGQYAVGRGAFFSEIVQLDGENAKTSMLLPPRYRSHEEQLASVYGLAGVRDIGLLAMWKWLKDALGFKAQPAAA